MVVFSNYSVQVIMSFLLMSMVFVLWPRADVSAQRIMEVLDTEPIVENGTKTAADVAKTGQRGTVGIPQRQLHLPGFARGDAGRHQLHRRAGPDGGVHRLHRLRQVVSYQSRAALL